MVIELMALPLNAEDEDAVDAADADVVLWGETERAVVGLNVTVLIIETVDVVMGDEVAAFVTVVTLVELAEAEKEKASS